MNPSALVESYERLLIDNVSTVQTVESAIRNITYFLPGRFEDAEIASEGLYSLLSLVSQYHDTLLSKRISPALSLPPHPFEPSTTTPTPVLPPSSDHARYTRYWTARSPLYSKASRVLTTLSYVELLLEMIARKRGDRFRWRIVLGIQSIKSFLRLILLGITKRSVLQTPTPQREYDITQLPSTIFDRTTPSTGTSQPILPTMPQHAPLRNHLYNLIPSLPEAHQNHPLTLLPELSGPSDYLSEILGSTSTLVHVMMLVYYSRKPSTSAYKPSSLPSLSRSLPPFLIPLFLLLAARRLRSRPSTVLQANHYASNDKQILSHFFLQGPMWVGWTRPKIMRVVKGLERIPLIGLVGELVEGYIPLVDDYFYYTSS